MKNCIEAWENVLHKAKLSSVITMIKVVHSTNVFRTKELKM